MDHARTLIALLPAFPQRRAFMDYLMLCTPRQVYRECGEMLEQLLILNEWQRYPQHHVKFQGISSTPNLGRVLTKWETTALHHVQETLTALRFLENGSGDEANPLRFDKEWTYIKQLMIWAIKQRNSLKEYGRIWGMMMPKDQSSPTLLPRTLFFYPVRPATREDLGRIVAFDQQAFSEDDFIPKHIFAGWLEKDPHSFIVVGDADGSVVGYYSLLFLKPQILQGFTLNCSPREKDFRKKDICTPEEISRQPAAYVFSIVAEEAALSLRYTLIKNLIFRAAHLYHHGTLRKLYAVAASRKGAELIRRAGFQSEVDGGFRADHYTLYCLDMTQEIVRKAEEMPC